MDVATRVIFIAGGTSGIGLELARRFASAGSTVVVGGRREAILRKLAGEGLGTVSIDVTDGESVRQASAEVLDRYPDLDVVIAMSGVIITENLLEAGHVADAEAIVDTNFLGTVRLVDAFLPHLLRRETGTIVTVGSASAFVPSPILPTYAASKAAVHVYSSVLRAQLAGTGVHVVELIPPAVTTTVERERANPDALRLTPFVDEVMALLALSPTPDEILVERVRPVRWADRDGTYAEQFTERVEAARGDSGS